MAGDGGGGGALQAREGGPDEWLRLYNRLVAMLRKSRGESEALLAERGCLQELIKIFAARDAVLRDSLRKTQAIQSCLRWCHAEKLDLLQIQMKHQDDDLKYLSAENSKLKLRLKEIENSAELGEKSTDPQCSARELRVERRERKKHALRSDKGKVQNMHSLASENNDKNQKLKAGHLQVVSAHDRLAVKLLKTSIISEVDPSDFQHAEDGTKVAADNSEEHPEQGGAASSQNGPEHFQRVTQALVMRLLQHEESVIKDGDGLAGMKQRDLIMWYVEQQNVQGVYSCTEEVKAEVKCINAIIERLIQCEGRLIVIDEGTTTADDGAARRGLENRLLAVKT